MVSDGVGHIEALFGRTPGFAVERHLTAGFEGGVVRCPAHEAEVVVETAIGGPVRAVLADVPFAGHEPWCSRRA